MRKNRRTLTLEAEVEVDVDIIVDFIENYASDSELEDVKSALKNANFPFRDHDAISFNSTDGSFIKKEKLALLAAAFKKYSLEELENMLGTKFDLI